MALIEFEREKKKLWCFSLQSFVLPHPPASFPRRLDKEIKETMSCPCPRRILPRRSIFWYFSAYYSSLAEILRCGRVAPAQEATNPSNSMPLFPSPLCCRFLPERSGRCKAQYIVRSLPRRARGNGKGSVTGWKYGLGRTGY